MRPAINSPFGGHRKVELTSGGSASDNLGMTLLSEPISGAWHRAPEWADAELRIADLTDIARPGRHAEPAWARELFDPVVDEDPFDWLGFAVGA